MDIYTNEYPESVLEISHDEKFIEVCMAQYGSEKSTHLLTRDEAIEAAKAILKHYGVTE